MTDSERKHGRGPRLVFLLLLISFAAWLGHRTWRAYTHVSTDNAQVDAHIVPIAPKVSGLVMELPVVDHQAVKAGDLLLRIDDRDYKARLAQAEAELELAIAAAGKAGATGQTQAQLAAARASASAARSAIEQALANADKVQKDLERTRGLIAQKMVSPQALDAAEAAARAAAAQVTTARETAVSAGEQVSASSAAVRGAVARVESARAAVDLAARQWADTRILAPANGIVAGRNVEAGQLVAAGQPLMSVVAISDVWVTANMKETEVRELQVGMKAEVEIDSYPGTRIEGRIESLSPATGARFALLPPDNATGNFTKIVQRIPVKVRVAQSSDPAHLLRPGMSAVVTIATR